MAPGSIYTLLCSEFGVGVMLMDRKGGSEMPPSFLPLSPDFCFLKFPFHCAGFPQQFERTRDYMNRIETNTQLLTQRKQDGQAMPAGT